MKKHIPKLSITLITAIFALALFLLNSYKKEAYQINNKLEVTSEIKKSSQYKFEIAPNDTKDHIDNHDAYLNSITTYFE